MRRTCSSADKGRSSTAERTLGSTVLSDTLAVRATASRSDLCSCDVQMGLDHVMLKVKNWHKAKEYYTAALQPLGYEPIADWGTGGGFGVPGEKTGSVFVVQGSLQLVCHVVDLLRLAAEPSVRA